MKILLLQVGKTKEKAYREIESEFLKRLSPFASLETATLDVSDFETENEELQKKLKKLKSQNYTLVALDQRGKSLSSEQLAEWIRTQRDFEGGKIAFIIGGPHGFEAETLKKTDVTLSFSKMTFTHQMVRLFLLEQLYRSFMILNNKSYHY